MTTYYFHTAFTLGRRTQLLMAAMSIPAVNNLVLIMLALDISGPRSRAPGLARGLRARTA